MNTKILYMNCTAKINGNKCYVICIVSYTQSFEKTTCKTLNMENSVTIGYDGHS